MAELKRYTLPLGNTILYSPIETFPPGSGTVWAADLAAQKLNDMRELSRNPNQQVNILDLGIGPGTFPIELLSKMHNPNGINIYGVDLDPLSVKLAKHNLKLAERKLNIKNNPQIDVANWATISFWDGLKRDLFNIVHFNPPYIKLEAEIPEKLREIPQNMVSAEGRGGLFHYRWVLPELSNVLSNQPGSSIIFRIPDYLNYVDLSSSEDFSLGRVLWSGMAPVIYNTKVSYYEPSSKAHYCKIERV